MAEEASSEVGADTRLFHAVHEAFRRGLKRLVDTTARLKPSELPAIIGPRWRFYEGALHHHHQDEDDGAFPALLAVRPDMRTLVETLEEDHRQLIPLMDSVGGAVAALQNQPDAAHQNAVHAALTSLRDMFFPHLDVEDAQILPAVAESVPPHEWDRLDEEALRSTPRHLLPTAVGGLDEVIQDLPADQRPPPPPLPIRFMLAVSWRRKWRQWVKPLLDA